MIKATRNPISNQGKILTWQTNPLPGIAGTTSVYADSTGALCYKVGIGAVQTVLTSTGGTISGTLKVTKLIVNNATDDGVNQLQVTGSAKVGAATYSLIFGSPVISGYGGIWTGGVTPAINNYAILANNSGNETLINAISGGKIGLRIANGEKVTINSTGIGIETIAPTHSLTFGSTSTGISAYNTPDQTTNYERVREAWSSSQYFRVMEAGGTGVLRSNSLTATSNLSSGSYILANDYLNLGQSGSAGYTARRISVYEQLVGSGPKLLLDLGTNSAANGSGTHTSKFSISNTGTAGLNIAASSNPLDINTGAVSNGGLRLLHSAGTPFATLRIKNVGVSNNTQFGTISNNDLEFLANSNIVGAAFGTGRWFFGSSPVDDGVSTLNVNGSARVQGALTVSSASGGTGTLSGLGSSTFSVQSNESILFGMSGVYYQRIDPNGVGINTGNVANNASAVLQVDSTIKGFLPPRMTATQASAISSPAQGLMLFVTDTNGTFTGIGWWGYNGSAWEKLNN